MGRSRALKLNEKLMKVRDAVEESDVGDRQMTLSQFERMQRTASRTSAALAREREAERVKGGQSAAYPPDFADGR